jgi:TrmH family RNA methyltransferase
MTVNEIKFIKKLHQKKYRSEEKKYFIEGKKLFLEAITVCPEQIECIYFTNVIKEIPHNIKSELISEKEMTRITALKNPSEVFVILKMKKSSEVATGNSLFLEDIKDPGNMGTIIRTADWFGIKTIYHTPETVDLYNPKVIQATMGSFFRVNFIETSSDSIKDLNHTLVGATLSGENVDHFKTPKNYCLVIGNESKGMKDSTIALLDSEVKIPGYGNAESLNASIAAGILLYKFSLT